MNLAKSAARGALLLSGANIAGYGASFAATLALARMVAPNDFGKAVFAIAVAEFMFIVGAWSLPIALIREPEETLASALDTALALLAGISTALLGLSAGVATGLWLLDGAQVALVFGAIIGGRVLQLFAGCFIACLEREFAYGRFSFIQLASTGAGAVSALALASRGGGSWALGVRDVSVSVTMFALALALTRRRPGANFSRAKAREMLRFGAAMIGSRLGEMLFHRFDNVVVGVVAGARQLGLYNQAYVLTEAGNRVYGPALQQLPMATYARIQDDRERTSRVFALLAFLLIRGVTPLALVFALMPGETLSVAYGEAWRQGAPILRWLSVYALLAPLFDQMRVVLVANGAVGAVLRARAIQLAGFLPALACATGLWGGAGAGAAVALGMVLGVAAILPAVRPYTVWRWSDVAPPALAAGAAAAAALAVLRGVDGDLRRLLLGGAALTAAYALTLAIAEGRRLYGLARTLLSSLRPETEAQEKTSQLAPAHVASRG